MKLFFKKTNKAFTLVETLVAISIFTMSILGLISILASCVSDISYAKQKIVASYLAQEGIEYVRNIRDNDVLYDPTSAQNGWNNVFINPFLSPILFPNLPSSTFYPINGSDFPGFTRTMSAKSISPDETTIISTVTWHQGSGNYNITFSEDLFNWVE